MTKNHGAARGSLLLEIYRSWRIMALLGAWRNGPAIPFLSAAQCRQAGCFGIRVPFRELGMALVRRLGMSQKGTMSAIQSGFLDKSEPFGFGDVASWVLPREIFG